MISMTRKESADRINHDQRDYVRQLLLGAITGGAITEMFGYLWVAIPALAVMLYFLVTGRRRYDAT